MLGKPTQMSPIRAADPFAGGDDLVAWEFDRAGPGSLGDRSLVYSAALQRIHIRRIGLVEARRHTRSQHWDPPGASDG